MALSLGEKLRQVREERGISISEVAEQTRISPLYLKSIEKDDYKPLPGGIFNKGFVRSYARYVGFDEEEALADYAQLMAEGEAADESDLRAYRPEVLTDDRAAHSMAPSIILAAIVLLVIIGGIALLIRYIANRPVTVTSNTVANTNVNANENREVGGPVAPAPASAFSVELKAITEPVWVRYSTEEGAKERTLSPNETLSVDVADTFKLSYAKVKAGNLQLSVNGKRVNVPSGGVRGNVEIEINRSNVAKIIQSGEIGGEPAAQPTPTASTPRPTPRPSTNTSVAAPANRPSLPPINSATPKRPPTQ
jgi:cytoskeletal protein RodZ